MSDIINPAGWTTWSKTVPNTDNVDYEEYGNSGAGSTGQRAGFSKRAAGPVAISSVLGGDYKNWVDTAYVSQ